MSRRQLKADDVDGFMLAAYDDLMEIQGSVHDTVSLSIHPGMRRGHWIFTATVAKLDAEGVQEGVCEAECVWPTHYATSIHALIYALLVRLEREIDRQSTI